MIPATLFLRAERRLDGHRTFRLPPGEPLPTSYGQDLYQSVFGTADQAAQVSSGSSPCLHRLGFFTPAPRHADLLLVTGPMIRAFDLAARKTYQAMPGPKVVVATGACALGGVDPPALCVPSQVGDVLPVDVSIPGCPPSPLALLYGLGVAVGRLAEKTPGLTFIADEDPSGGET